MLLMMKRKMKKKEYFTRFLSKSSAYLEQEHEKGKNKNRCWSHRFGLNLTLAKDERLINSFVTTNILSISLFVKQN